MNINKNIIKKAAVLFAVVFTVSGCDLPKETDSQAAQVNLSPEPLIYESGGEVYMTSGADTVLLPGAGMLNGVFAAGSLYYITDTEDTGAGTLMRADRDCKSAAAAAAENVCDAEISPGGDILILRDMDRGAGEMYFVSAGSERLIATDVSYIALSENGERSLFISGEMGGTGELYSWDMRGNTEFIANGVSPNFLGFSPNAKNIYYVTKDGLTYALYVKLGGERPVMLDERNGGEDGAQCFDGAWFKGRPLSDSGQMVYFGNEWPLGSMYVYYPGAETERYSDPSMLFNTFDDGSILFMSQDELYYKAPGKPGEKISEYPRFFPWFGCYYYPDMPQVLEKRFLFMEDYTDFEGPHISLFEQETGKDALKLGDADMESPFNINYEFTRIAYKLDGSIYIREKRKLRWSKPELVAEDVKISMVSESRFDLAGTYFYYLSEESDAPISGSLYRYDLDEKKSELLFEGVREFYLTDETLYALTAKEEIWVLGDSKKKLADGMTGGIYIVKACGGVFLKTGYEKGSLYYYNMDSGETIKLCEDVKWLIADGILYRPPLTEEQRASLQKLWQDAKACIAELDAVEELSDYSQDALLADKLRSEVSEKYYSMLDDFCNGFISIPYDQIDGDYKILGGGNDAVKHFFSDAIAAYEDMFGAEAPL